MRKIIQASRETMTVPASYSFRGLNIEMDGKDYSSWWFTNVADMLTTISNIITDQGWFDALGNFLDLRSFRPAGDFVWIDHISSNVILYKDDIDVCPFDHSFGRRLFVPAGWSLAVLEVIRNQGVVQITNSNTPFRGRRWNGEIVPVEKYRWRR